MDYWIRGFQHSIFNILHSSQRGVATLPTVMILGVMALSVAVGVTTVAFTESFISQGAVQSNKALIYAEAGARDALIRIARDNRELLPMLISYFTNAHFNLVQRTYEMLQW